MKQNIKLPKGIKINPVSMVDMMEIRASIESEYRENKEPLDVPTYQVAVGDEFQPHDHNETTLETDEDRAAWDAYIDANERLDTEVALYTTKYLLVEGIEIDWKLFKDWEAKKKKYKIRIPEDEDDKKIYFLTSTAFPTPADQKQAAQAVMLASIKGSDKEQVEAIEALFRDQMEE